MRIFILAILCAAFAPGCCDSTSSLSHPLAAPAYHPSIDLKFIRQIRVTGKNRVPDKRVWEFDDDDVAEGKVTTSDVFIDGRWSIDGLEFEGESWLNFQKAHSHPVWLYASTEVGLGDTRLYLVVNEFAQLTP